MSDNSGMTLVERIANEFMDLEMSPFAVEEVKNVFPEASFVQLLKGWNLAHHEVDVPFERI